MSIYGNSVGHPLPNPRKGMDMTGSINMNGHQLGGLAEPVKDSDATSKGYVDNAIKCILTKYTVTLFADGWADNLQKVAVDFATSSNTIFSSPDPAYYDLYTENGVIVTEQADGSVTFRCESVPDADIIVNLAIFNPLPISQKEPVAYLYNGVRLPKLPEWDSKYRKLFIFRDEEESSYDVIAAESVEYTYNGAKFAIDPHGEYCWYYCDDGSGTWEFYANTSNPFAALLDRIVWANFDVLGEDGTTYLAASDPIPVYA